MTRTNVQRPGSSLPFINIRKIPDQNIALALMKREMSCGKPGTQINQARRFYTSIVPNLSVVNVEKPPCFLRKFSPDGKYFLAFSANQEAIEIYDFKGSSAAAHILQDVEKETYGFEDNRASANVRTKLFDLFFKLRSTTTLCRPRYHLNRECSLFTDDGRYVIVASATYIPEAPHLPLYDVYTHNECVSPGTRFPLENYNIHIVDMASGIETENLEFLKDKIGLAHNQGLYLYKSTLVVFSMQKQSIYIFVVTSNGTLISERVIGRFCYEDDQLFLSLVQGTPSPRNAFSEPTINSLKHRFLVHLYKKAMHISQEENNQTALLKFYQNFEQFQDLRMWKVQLLDSNHLLIRYASEQIVALQYTSDPNSAPSFFVVYHIPTTKVLSVFENTSTEFLELYDNFTDFFRNAGLHNEVKFTCSASSNIYAQQVQERFKETIVNAKGGGVTEATKRMLAQLPISSQSFSSSPYLDLQLYSYDDKWVSIMERPKTCGEHPIRWVQGYWLWRWNCLIANS